jgi:hypothetical protein
MGPKRHVVNWALFPSIVIIATRIPSPVRKNKKGKTDIKKENIKVKHTRRVGPVPFVISLRRFRLPFVVVTRMPKNK